MHMFCHFMIHSLFEHGFSHTRAKSAGSEEPDSTLSDGLSVHRLTVKFGRVTILVRERALVGLEVVHTDTDGEQEEHSLTGTRGIRTRPYRAKKVKAKRRDIGWQWTGAHWSSSLVPAFSCSSCTVRSAGIGWVSARLCSCVHVPIPIKPAQLKREQD